MPTNLTKLAAVRRAVKRLVKAEIADSWKGGTMPEDWSAIERELERAKDGYERAMRQLAEAT